MSTCLVEAAGQPVTLPGRGSKPLGEAQTTVLAAARELARQTPTDPDGWVTLARMDVAKLAKERGVKKSSTHSTWQSLQSRGYLRLVEPGSVRLRLTQ